MGAEGLEANIEARSGDFGAGARIGNVVELIEKCILQRGRDSVGDSHAALGGDAGEIYDDDFASVV